jgi:hypothetical protein
MVNVFYDGVQWRISTKSMVDGNGKFFNREKSFSDMFYEILNKKELTLDVLNTDYCYSFVMQHPENRIVTHVPEMMLYLTNMYRIDGNTIYSVDPRKVTVKEEQMPFFMNIPAELSFSEGQIYVDDMVNFNALKEYIMSLVATENYDKMGIQIYVEKYEGDNKVFEVRGKMRSPLYEKVRPIRGNQPKLQYRFCELYLQGELEEFYQYYPEYQMDMKKMEVSIGRFIHTLFKNYRNCYIRKMKPLKEFEYAYKSHMYQLHQNYKTKLAPKGRFIDMYYVTKYVKMLHPSQLMYSMSRMDGLIHHEEEENTTETAE